MADQREMPILFSGPMVRAILDGRKTVTRRVLKPQPRINSAGLLLWNVPRLSLQGDVDMIAMHQKWQRGDRMWVREAWRCEARWDDVPPRRITHDSPIYYAADPDPRDSEPGCAGRLRPSMFMPRWASRITLEVTGVKVERLQDISEAEAIAEGVERSAPEIDPDLFRDYVRGGDCDTARLSYETLWTSINGPGSWEANPWVVAISFKRL